MDNYPIVNFTFCSTVHSDTRSKLIDDELTDIFFLVYFGILCGVISFFGIIANNYQRHYFLPSRLSGNCKYQFLHPRGVGSAVFSRIVVVVALFFRTVWVRGLAFYAHGRPVPDGWMAARYFRKNNRMGDCVCGGREMSVHRHAFKSEKISSPVLAW